MPPPLRESSTALCDLSTGFQRPNHRQASTRLRSNLPVCIHLPFLSGGGAIPYSSDTPSSIHCRVRSAASIPSSDSGSEGLNVASGLAPPAPDASSE
eukprot:546263-Rhodomonas_salina.1